MKTKFALFLTVILSGCCDHSPDGKTTNQIFIECLQNAQKQPASGSFNDESDVVNACRGAALGMGYTIGECK